MIFPIYAINIVDFEYACDCDTVNYIKRSEKYNDIVISDDNFDNYYDFVFSEKFTKVISQISFGDFNEGIEFDLIETMGFLGTIIYQFSGFTVSSSLFLGINGLSLLSKPSPCNSIAQQE